jgi:hypothetical protein
MVPPGPGMGPDPCRGRRGDPVSSVSGDPQVDGIEAMFSGVTGPGLVD